MNFKKPLHTAVHILATAVIIAFSSVTFRATGAQAAAGFRDFSFNASSVSAPTGQKPQSKTWFNNGLWWGSLYNVATGNYEIYRLNIDTQQWSTTGTVIDTRNSSRADMLWDGNHLYAVSAGTAASSTSATAKVMRYSFDPRSNVYTLDSGFPVTLGTAGGMETIVMTKAADAMLWVTYTKGSKVYVAHSTTSDTSWTAPYLINATGSNTLTADDISSIIAYGDSVGIMWGNQNDQKMYFATHSNGSPDTIWNSEVAISGSHMADDHINLKADPLGQVYGVTKTSRNDVSSSATEPIIVLSVRNSTGAWSNYTVAQQSEGSVTRGIVSIDETDKVLYVFYTDNESGGSILYKQTPLDTIAFSNTPGSVFIQSTTDTHLNNASTSKQNITPASGLLVMAGDDTTKYYDHNYVSLNNTAPSPSSSPSPTPTPTPTPTPSPTPTPTPTPTASPAGIAFRSSTTGTNGGGSTSVAAAAPANLQAGDVELAHVVVRGTSTAITPPSGWQLIRRDVTASAMAVALYYKVASAAEPTSYIFKFNSSQEAVLGLSAYSGVSNINPIDASSSRYNASTSTMAANGVTTTTANDRLLWFGSLTYYYPIVTPPTDMTNRYAINNGVSTGVNADMADLGLTTVGATGDKVGSNNASKSSICQLVALRPAN